MADFITDSYRMTSGRAEAAERKYHKHISGTDRIYLVADQPNAADNIYVSGDEGSQGFGGSTLSFTLVDGTEMHLKGPWHTNSHLLKVDTGIDIQDKHETFVVVARDQEYVDGRTILKDVLYQDAEPTIGFFERGKPIAQKYANELGVPVYLYSQSRGGSSCGPVKPATLGEEV